jgi:hypothetical protein
LLKVLTNKTRKMKRKIIISVVLCLFAGLTVFNVGLANRPDNSDTTLDLISVMAKALEEGEGEGKTYWCWTDVSLGGVLTLRKCIDDDPNSLPSVICGGKIRGCDFVSTGQYLQCSLKKSGEA